MMQLNPFLYFDWEPWETTSEDTARAILEVAIAITQMGESVAVLATAIEHGSGLIANAIEHGSGLIAESLEKSS